jgi:hypothetical protein
LKTPVVQQFEDARAVVVLQFELRRWCSSLNYAEGVR